ncbi:uncharacterized protein N7496_010031 [Penicillium cataractarum]|uniref:Uncharacterized protein n=1 Tax=Penicillium cataractarum TaxID=2100454 RepID=A0A9W9RUX8_9EURO|nr:uncharacterized protein N7496_010031 [Penicillium cataractarum]KAJ5364318.1 hypothetical protein N7496_010031 [Penicillium cataractarum]
MLFFTTLLFAASTFAALQPGTPCGTNLQCSKNCLDGEYISTAADGFVRNPAATDNNVYVYGACNSVEEAEDFCNKQKGTICANSDQCLITTTKTQEGNAYESFVGCGATPTSTSQYPDC